MEGQAGGIILAFPIAQEGVMRRSFTFAGFALAISLFTFGFGGAQAATWGDGIAPNTGCAPEYWYTIPLDGDASQRATPDNCSACIEAVETRKERAKQGDVRAQHDLGVWHGLGHCVPINHVEAVTWLRKASEQGDAASQHLLGMRYIEGHSVPQDDAKAVRLFLKAAEQGYVKSQRSLGIMYREGQGVPQDNSESKKWFEKAAKQGDAVAGYALLKLYDKVAEQGSAEDQYNHGVNYYEGTFNGKRARKNFTAAITWFTKAAEGNYAKAQRTLGYMLSKGQGASQDDTEAAKWFLKAAEQGNASGQYHLGFMYAKGKGVEQDDAKAIKWLRKAADQGGHWSQSAIAHLYAEGRAVPQDETEDAKWREYKIIPQQVW